MFNYISEFIFFRFGGFDILLLPVITWIFVIHEYDVMGTPFSSLQLFLNL